MGDNYNKELCEERHHRIDSALEKLFKKLDIYTILIAFMTIATLVIKFIR